MSFPSTPLDWLAASDVAVVEGGVDASFFSFNLNIIFGAEAEAGAIAGTGVGVDDCDEMD